MESKAVSNMTDKRHGRFIWVQDRYFACVCGLFYYKSSMRQNKKVNHITRDRLIYPRPPGEWRVRDRYGALRGGSSHQSRRRWDQTAGGWCWDWRILQEMQCPAHWGTHHWYDIHIQSPYFDKYARIKCNFMFIIVTVKISRKSQLL